MPIPLTGAGVVADPASPLPAPGVPVIERSGLAGMTWTGRDGVTWDLMRPSSGVFLMKGVIGLFEHAYSSWTAETGSHGQTQRGGRFPARQVAWPVHLYHDGDSLEFVERWSAWRRSFPRDMTRHDPGIWEVTAPDGTKRRLRLRLEDLGAESEFDPTVRGWMSFASKLVADQPFWEGDPVSVGWGGPSTGSGNFLRPSRGVGVIEISGGFTVDTATMSNPGDEPAWPVWTLYGPWKTARLGVDGAVVTVPFPGVAGDVLTVDCRTASAALNGVDVTDRLASWDFAPIPPGRGVPLDVAIDGGGRIGANITPLYHNAFG